MRIFTFCLKYTLLLGITLFSALYVNAQQIIANNQQAGRSGLVCLNCTINNSSNAADGDLQSYSTLNVSLGILAQTWQEVIFPGTDKVPAGTTVTIKLGSGDNLLSLQALGAILLRAYNGNTPVGNAIAANTLVSLLSNNNQYAINLTPAGSFDRIRVTLDGGVAGALNSIYLYGAYYKDPGTTICNTAFDELHGISAGLLNLGLNVGGVVNPLHAIDGNAATASTLNAGVGLVGAYAQQTIIFNNISTVGDSVKLTLSIPQNLLDAGVQSNITISTYNGNTANNDEVAFNSGLLNVRLLDLSSNRRAVSITYAPPRAFDRVQLRLGGGIANVLSTLNLNELRRLIPRPVINYNGTVASTVQACSGTSISLNASAVPNTTFSWYTQATGGAPIFTGATFTTPALTATTTYYIEAVRSGCTDASERTPVTIQVNAVPLAPGIANASVDVCSGGTATFAAINVNGAIINWYDSPTGGTPVFTGNNFTTNALTQTATFYAEAVTGGQCISATRTPVTATVVAPPAQPVITTPNVTICSGDVAVLSVSNPQNDIQYNWYSTATGGTILYTGSTFTTLALSAGANYYAEAVNSTGCSSTQRAEASVTVQPKPADPILIANNSVINSGQSATIGVSNAQTGITYNWYTSATASTPVFSGVNFQTPALYTNTTFYVGAVNSAGCSSVNKTAVTVQVTINNNSPCSFATLQTGTISGICVACDIENRPLAVDADTTTASTIRVPAGLTGGYAEQELRFQQAGFTGDTIKLVLQTPVGLADVSLLGQIEVALFNGNTQVVRYVLNNSLLQVRALGGSNRYAVYIPATGNYDRVTVRLNSGLVGLLSSLKVFYALQQFTAPVVNPASPEICKGSTAQLNITAPANGTFNWYTTPTGGTSVFAGTNFTTPVLNSNTVYYIEYSRNGCVSPMRYPVQVLVNDVPAAPVAAAGTITINSGQTATVTATPPANATINWYTAAIGGTPVFSGNTFTSPTLTTNTTYYAEAALGSCVSATRTPVKIVVNPMVIPDITVNPPAQTVYPGQTVTFTASSTTPGAVFNWYTTSNGGTPVFTGDVFVTPSQFDNTTYYAEAVVPATGAVSASRATAIVTVNQSGPNPVACDAAIDQTTAINGVVCLGCTVANAAGSVDNDRNTFAQLNVPVGLLNAYAQQTLRFAGTGHAGDSVIVELGLPGSLADISLLSRITLATYNGTTYNNDRFNVNAALLNVSLLNGQSRFRAAFVAQQDFDRVEIRLNSAVGAFNTLNIYDAAQEVAAPVITTQNVAACQGSQATLSATVTDGVTVRWYTTATGGTPVFTGTTFTTPALNATTTYYAEASRTATGCIQAIRTPAVVTITPVPAAPQIMSPSVTVCYNQPATFTAQTVNGVTVNWYTTPTGGTPIFTGNVFNTGPLLSTTLYYAEGTVSGQCSSVNRTQVTANVSNAVNDAVIAQSPVQVCASSSAVLTSSSTQPGVTFNWYTSATGGTPVFTGAQFNTPALTANTSYYVQVSAGSCVSANRVKAVVIVNPLPVAPTVTLNPAGGQIISGQTVTLTASSTTPNAIFNWYTTGSGGTPVFTGAVFTTPGLTANTTYYVETTSAATGCVSTIRTPVNIIVSPVFSTNCDFASSQTNDVNSGLACIGCTVTNPNDAVDSDTTNFSRLNIIAGVAGSYVAQSLVFNETGGLGDTVSIRLRFPVNIVSAGVLDRIRIGSYNGTNYNNDGILLNSNVVRVQILSGGQTALIRFAPQAGFDRVEVRLNSALAGLFNTVDVFYASKQVEAPQLAATTANICSGNTATFNISNTRNGVSYNWYATPTGGTPVFTGASFTTPVLTATTTYYAESVRTGNNCPNPNRVAANVNVTPAPANAVLAQNNLKPCAGEQVTLSVTNAAGATVNWYDAPTGGNLIFIGSNFLISPIVTTSYYAELTNNTCTSATRTQATVTVNPRPSAPGLLADITDVCAGSSATLQVSNPESGVNYEWFTVANGGTPIFTGNIFVTPAITQNTIYYVQATTGSCINNGGRIAATVTVNGQITAPVLSAATQQVCSGGNTSVSVVNPVAGLQYNWYTTASGGTPVFTGTTFSLNNLIADVNYYVEAINSNGCTSAARTVTSITIVPPPAAPQVQAPVGGLNVCSGSNGSLSIANPQGSLVYRWFDSATGGTLLYTGTQFTTPALTANTTYYVEAADAGNCNPSARTGATITVNDLPADVVLVSANVAVCSGNTATLSVSSPQAGVTYQWFDSPQRTTKLFDGPTFVTDPILANTTFYVSAVNATGCASTGLATAQVTVQQAPGAPVIANGNSVQSCTGAPVTLTIANPENGTTYNWYTAATGGSPVFAGISFTTGALTNDVTYYAEATSAGGCTSTTRTAVSITVNALPAPPAVTAQGGASSPSVCTGSSVILTATSTTANAGFNWYTQASGGTPVFSGAVFNTPNLSSNAMYYVEAFVSATGCTSSTRTAVTVTVNSLPADAVLASDNITVCSGSAATFTVSSPQAGIVYQWFDSADLSNKVFEGTTYVTSPLTANTAFYVSAVNATGCSSVNAAIAKVTVQQIPAVPVIANGSTQQICSDMPATITIANPQVGLIYNWYTTAGGGVPVFTGPSFTTGSLTANAIYYAEASNNTGCKSATRAQVNVNVNPIPAAPVITPQGGSTSSVCAGSSITLTATSTTPGVIYNWYTAVGSNTPDFTGPTFVTPQLSASTTFYAEAVSSTGSCASTTRTPIQVTINTSITAAPQVNMADLTICQNTTANLHIINPEASTIYNWYTTAEATNSIYTGAVFVTPVLNANTTYYVQAISAQSCNASARVPVNVVVVPSPATPIPAASVVNICTGNGATLSVASPQAGITYNWYNSVSQAIPLFTGASYTTGPVNATTTYYVSASGGSCGRSALASVMVVVAQAPAAPITINNNVEVCAGSQAVFVIANPQAGLTYQWYSSADGGAPLFTGTTFTTPQINANVIWYVQAVNTIGCTSATRTPVNAILTPAPAAPQISSQGTDICAGSAATLNATVDGQGISIKWYASSKGGIALFTGNSFTTPVLTGNTTYYAEATNSGGCSSSDRTPVTVHVQASLPAPVVIVSAVTLSSVTFKWSAVTGATGYEVSLDNGKTFIVASSGNTGLTHSITGLQPAQTVTILVKVIGQSPCQLSAVSPSVTGTAENPFGNGLYLPNAFSPNGDGNNDYYQVLGNNIKTMTLWIYNQWGEVLFRGINQNSTWDGTAHGKSQPVGVYVYVLDATMNDGQKVMKKGTINLLR